MPGGRLAGTGVEGAEEGFAASAGGVIIASTICEMVLFINKVAKLPLRTGRTPNIFLSWVFIPRVKRPLHFEQEVSCSLRMRLLHAHFRTGVLGVLLILPFNTN